MIESIRNSSQHMITRIRNSSQHTVLGIIEEGVPAFLNSLKTIINRIANHIFLQVVISSALFYLHPNSFYIGMAFGFVFHKQVSEIAENVNNVFIAFQNQRILFFGVGGLMAIMAAESALIISTLYYSSLWGAKICIESQPVQQPSDPPSRSSIPSSNDVIIV